MSDSVCGFEYDSELYMGVKILNLSCELFLNVWGNVRKERKIEKEVRLRREKEVVIRRCTSTGIGDK